MHKHAARRLHYDLRLEWGGVLKSWAVPKGPSLNPADKRLAVRVEDHPIEYGDFEGIIPEGNYGAGAVIVWDRGVWQPVGDPEEGSRRGKLLFDLRGYKLRGRWTLVKIKKSENDWLLIKERDTQVAQEGEVLGQGSVLSGLTVEELKAGHDPSGPIVATLRRLGAPRRSLRAADVEPMLAEPRERPFSRAGWVYELKLDGYRFIAGREGEAARLVSRGGHDFTAAFPEVARALAALPFDGIVMDGELVVPDEAGRPSFQRLQQRARLTKPFDIRRGAVESPAALYLFDLLALDGFDLRPLPLLERKAVLRDVVPDAGALRYSEHFERGEELFEQVVRLGFEGIVAKRADAPYRAGRTALWIKVRADRTDDFVVVGFSEPKGSRGGFGALHLAQFEKGLLTYAGRVGSGFAAAELDVVRGALESARRDAPPCGGPVPGGEGHVWVDPGIVCEVRYKEWTAEGLLRQPVFLRFREDKQPAECLSRRVGSDEPEDAGRDDPGPAPAGSTDDAPAGRPAPASPPSDVQLSNTGKIFWPEDGFTKGDLLEYYRAISPWLLPYLRDRPVVMTRFPDGIHGKSFFQKDAPAFAPEWLRTVRMWSAQSQRELDYFVCESESALLYVINLGSIPLHIWASRVATLEHPDWCILDLDPKGAPFADVVTVARATKALCDEIGLPSFVKTSGSSGLHVLVPLGRQCTYEQSRTLGGLLARLVAAELPEIATVTRQVSRRDGRVYLDYVQNGHGRLLVAPFSARPVPGGWVSMPLQWKEVGGRLDIGRFTIKNAPGRMKRLKEDPLAPVMEARPDLPAALERLHERFSRTGRRRR